MRITGGPHETFGVSTVVVRYSGAQNWDRLVAVLAVGTTPITAGGVKLNGRERHGDDQADEPDAAGPQPARS